MDKKNILVFPCGSEIGLEIYHSVRYSTHFRLIGLSSVEDHGRFVFENCIVGAPFVTDDALIPYLADLVRRERIDAVYPTMDSAITVLKAHEAELGCRIVCPPADTTALCLSKSATYSRLSGIVRTPAVYDEVASYPVFCKPDVGYGGRGAAVIHSAEQLREHLRSHENTLITEYLPGDEYTVDCFTDRHGVLRYARARKRNRIKSGISVNTFFVSDQEAFQRMAEKIAGAIEMRGAWFFQVKRTEAGELCLMEVAARFGGSSSLSMAIGVNLPLLSLFDIFDHDVAIEPNDYPVVLDRALDNKFRADIEYDEVYVDYDDCLILDKTRVNDELVAFLYRCLNAGRRTVLLSRHDGDLAAELKAFRLDTLFDEVIHISRQDDKYRYIASPTAIFIDDSHAERAAVREKVGIPVFSPEMVCVL